MSLFGTVSFSTAQGVMSCDSNLQLSWEVPGLACSIRMQGPLSQDPRGSPLPPRYLSPDWAGVPLAQTGDLGCVPCCPSPPPSSVTASPPSSTPICPQHSASVSQGPWRGGSQDEHPNSFDWSFCSTVSPPTPASMPSTRPHSLVPVLLKLLLSRQVTQGTQGPAPVHPVASPSTPDPEGSCSPPLLPVLIPLPEMPFLPSLLAQLRHAL